MEMMRMRKYDIDHYPDFKMRRRMAMMMGDPEALCKYSNIHTGFLVLPLYHIMVHEVYFTCG